MGTNNHSKFPALRALFATVVLGFLLFSITLGCWFGLWSWPFGSPWLNVIVFPTLSVLAYLSAGWLSGRRSLLPGPLAAILVATPTFLGFLFLSPDSGAGGDQGLVHPAKIGTAAFLLVWLANSFARRWPRIRARVPWSGVLIGIGLFVGVMLLNTAFWLTSARAALVNYAWPALVTEHFRGLEDKYLPSCVAIDPALYRGTPIDLREEARLVVEHRGVQFRVAPPTHRGGYADRECVEYYAGPQVAEFWAFNLPGAGAAVIAYNNYDTNGDAVLMLQVGPHWKHVRSWNAYF